MSEPIPSLHASGPVRMWTLFFVVLALFVALHALTSWAILWVPIYGLILWRLAWFAYVLFQPSSRAFAHALGRPLPLPQWVAMDLFVIAWCLTQHTVFLPLLVVVSFGITALIYEFNLSILDDDISL